jgi:hypothetical protein
MTINSHEKFHPLPGGVSDDGTAAGRDASDMGSVPDFSTLSPQLGKNPTVGSWLALCFNGPVSAKMPGYMNLRKKGSTGATGKVRIPLYDAPDG